MNYNFHTHTAFCHHANGEIREYIECAIKGGIKYMGFSDHIPRHVSSGQEDGYRIHTTEAEKYIKIISSLREEYKNDIEIKIGFEAEYYRDEFKNTLQYAKSLGAEYLILGQHFILSQGEGSHHCNNPSSDERELEIFTEEVAEGIESGFFTYVAHPDVYNFSGDVSTYKDKMRKICIASKNTGIPLEINFLGIRENRIYPKEAFWEVAGEVGSPVTFGMDAHAPNQAADMLSYKKALKIVDKFGLNYIGKPKQFKKL